MHYCHSRAGAVALARARLEGARARLGVAERELADASVKAPFDGRVARRFVSEGEFVKVGAELFELVSYDPLEVEFNLAEIDSGRVRLGQSVEVRVAPYPEQVFSATVTYISPTIDATTLRGAFLRPVLHRDPLLLRLRIPLPVPGHLLSAPHSLRD